MSLHTNTKSLVNKFESLPKSTQNDVLSYLDFLISKFTVKKQKKKVKFTFKWEGELSHLKNQYTSVELQHKINEFR
jgi:hypothetical protein